jgi:chromosome segregation ATPase
MATDNKNNSSPDADSDEGSTLELEIIHMRSAGDDELAEADASPYAFDNDYPDGLSIDTLKSDMRSRDEFIGELQFDVEQLRARRKGLEKEISAREELTGILQQDLAIANKERASQEKRIKMQQRKLDSLSSDPDEAIDIKPGKDGVAPQSLQQQLDAARISVSDLTAYVDSRKNDWDQIGDDIELHKASIAEKDKALADFKIQSTESQRTISSMSRNVEQLETRLEEERASSKQLEEMNRALTRDIDNYQSNNHFDIDHHLAEQSGQLISNRDEIGVLKGQIARSEQYANELRERLQTLDIFSKEHANNSERLDASLQEANARIEKLSEQLDAEKVVSADLLLANSDLHEAFEQQTLQIRFDLGTAQETLVDYESTNEELSSNLIDNKHYRHALEEQLHSSEEKHVHETGKLENIVSKLQQRVVDDQRKIEHKDTAITTLLDELASKREMIESMGDVGDPISEIDERMPDPIDLPSGPDRDRPIRLLVGVIDGQELQFPLFKERLTIGRTSQNDIQLKAQHISRRHAVILSDDDGPRIIDWGSKNGISVNGREVAEQRLSKGDRVKIGTAEFIFEERKKR